MMKVLFYDRRNGREVTSEQLICKELTYQNCAGCHAGPDYSTFSGLLFRAFLVSPFIIDDDSDFGATPKERILVALEHVKQSGIG